MAVAETAVVAAETAMDHHSLDARHSIGFKAWARNIFTEVEILQHNPKREMLRAVTFSHTPYR